MGQLPDKALALRKQTPAVEKTLMWAVLVTVFIAESLCESAGGRPMLFAWAAVVFLIRMFSFHTLYRRFLLQDMWVIESQVLLGARFPSHQ
mgnify:CR=1 FL=1